MNVFQDKTCEAVEGSDKENLRQGRDLEEYVAKRFTEATGLKVRRCNYMLRSKKYQFMIADVDRLIVGEDAGLECKTVSAYNADKWKAGEVPFYYMLQCYHYMAVTGRRTWYLAAVILGKDFVYHKLEWDDSIIDYLIQEEKKFWENHILTGILPSPDGSKSCDEIIGNHFHKAKEKSQIALIGFDNKLNRRQLILEQIEELEKEQKQIEQEVKMYMQENEIAISEKYYVSWSNVESKRLDTKRIRAEKPEICKDYLMVSETRKFQIKTA